MGTQPRSAYRGSSHILGKQTFIGGNTHFFILIVLIMLSYPSMNPVQRVCALLGTDDATLTGHACVCLLIWAIWSDLNNVVFHMGRTFLSSLLAIFVSSVDVVGIENLPMHGPAILVANHFNQFADGLTVMLACHHRRISFLFARKSFDSLVVGFFARAMQQVPVSRPQDLAFQGMGVLLSLEPEAESKDGDTHRLVGSEACQFRTQLAAGAKITFGSGKVKATWKVLSIESECVCLVSPVLPPPAKEPAAAKAAGDTPPPSPTTASVASFPPIPADGKYRIVPRGDFEVMLKDVVSALEGGACIGVFPEGGSHDRTDLNELKPGVALMALGSKGAVPIVPVGLSYFKGHQFRAAKVTVQFGPPISASEDEQAGFEAGGEAKHRACSSLLARVAQAMRDVIVPAESYEELQVIHVARRLWCGPDKQKLAPAARQDLDRRFAFGIRRMLRQTQIRADGGAAKGSGAEGVHTVEPRVVSSAAADGAGAAPIRISADAVQIGTADLAKAKGKEGVGSGGGAGGGGMAEASTRERELRDFGRRLRDYDRQLRRLGLRDAQVPSLRRAPIGATLFTLGKMLAMGLIATLPTVVLNAPVGLAAKAYANQRQRASLKSSEVKLSAHDVLLSEKMKFAIVGVPLLWLSYAAVLLVATPMRTQDVLTLLMCAPVASYIGVISAESGMLSLRDLRPMLVRLTFSRADVDKLKLEQMALRDIVAKEIREMVKSDEVVRELYHTPGELSSTDWERLRRGPGDTSPERRKSGESTL